MDLASLLPQVVAISKTGGAFIQEAKKKFDWNDLEYKGNNDLVSFVDKETERLLVNGLSALLPEAGFITEEGTITQEKKPWQWVIDPLDGTTNFVHGVPLYSVSIGLLHEGIPVLGVVYEVNREECFHACKDQPACLNGQEIQVSPISTLAESILATGYPHIKFDHLEPYLSLLGDLMRNTHGIRRMGSAAVDLAYVACGRVSAFFEHNLNIYDVAAGIVIVQQAGGVVTDYQGANNYLTGRQILAANAVHQQLLAAIQKHWNL